MRLNLQPPLLLSIVSRVGGSGWSGFGYLDDLTIEELALSVPTAVGFVSSDLKRAGFFALACEGVLARIGGVKCPLKSPKTL